MAVPIAVAVLGNGEVATQLPVLAESLATAVTTHLAVPEAPVAEIFTDIAALAVVARLELLLVTAVAAGATAEIAISRVAGAWYFVVPEPSTHFTVVVYVALLAAVQGLPLPGAQVTSKVVWLTVAVVPSGKAGAVESTAVKPVRVALESFVKAECVAVLVVALASA